MGKVIGAPVVLNRATMMSDQTTLASNTANVLTPILTYIVPRGQVIESDLSKPFFIELATREEITPAGTHGAETTTYIPCRVYKPNDAAYADGVKQRVSLKSAGTARAITAVGDHVDSTAAGSITCSDETNAAHMYCYVPWASGELIVRIKAPGGAGEISRNIWEGNIRTLHEINQRRDNRPIVWGCALPENFKIEILLKAAWVAYWASGDSAGAINLPFADVEIPCLSSPMAAWNRQGDKVTAQRTIQEALEWVAGH
jgi:hypothetical protein